MNDSEPPFLILIEPCSIATPFVEPPSIPRIPVPFGVIDISPLAPSAITIEPEFVPEFVLSVKSPVLFVVIVTFSPLPPICTVSVPRFTFPVPCGIMSICAFDVETIS